MLLESTDDPILIEIIQQLGQAEDEEQLDVAFEQLNRLGTVRQREFKKAVDEARKKADVPRTVAKTELESALAELADWMPMQDDLKPGQSEADE